MCDKLTKRDLWTFCKVEAENIPYMVESYKSELNEVKMSSVSLSTPSFCGFCKGDFSENIFHPFQKTYFCFSFSAQPTQAKYSVPQGDLVI